MNESNFYSKNLVNVFYLKLILKASPALLVIILFLFIFTCCDEKEMTDDKTQVLSDTITLTDTVEIQEEEIISENPYSLVEINLLNSGLTDVQTLDSSIVVDLKYSGIDNFMEADVYGDWNRAFLQAEVAEKLVIAQHLLKSKFPEYSLIVFDAVRPVSVQQKMWDNIEMPINEKTKYLSNPQNGSLHNFGAAVDVSIVDENKEELDMGTPFDYFGELAYPSKEQDLLNSGELSQKQINNRKLLRDVMKKSGFSNLSTEWWHFNSCSRSQARIKYELVQ